MVYGYKINNPISLSEIFTVSKQRFEGGYFFGGESHSFYEVVCVLSGRVGITAERNVYVLSQGQMTIHRPGEFHAIWEEGDSNPEVIIFTFSASPFPSIKSFTYSLDNGLVDEIGEIYKACRSVFKISGDKVYFGDSGKTVFENGLCIEGVNDGMRSEAVRLIKRIEIFLSRALENAVGNESASHGEENYARILDVMQKNLGQALSVCELAQSAGMSVPALEKTVFRYMHCGAISYYNILRMERARAMLLSGKSVKETAFALGYANQNYFSACFKKRYGYSPSEVKKREAQ